jgi:peptidoglycan-associated lipoprotein
MNQRTQAYMRAGAIVLACFLLIFVSACKKKAPAPAPPPPPAKTEAPPPPPAKPTIANFTAEPRSIERGQASTLRWSVSNATDISIDQGVGAVQSNGSRSVYPSTTTTYTLVANGPGGSATRSVTVDVAAPPPPPPPPPPKVKRTAEDWLASEVQDVYFDYDRSDVREDARTVLNRNADVLKQILSENPNFVVQLEGHCDERGSAEYNLGLGDRRASATKEYLTQLGVPADRLRTISYGKERPVCTDANESCYQRNRRAHFAPAQ